MNSLRVFNYQEKEIRTVEKDGERYWIGKDVCDVLLLNTTEAIKGRKNRKFKDGLDEEDYRDDIDIVDTIGRIQKTLCITESGLYNLIFKSRVPQAKAFKRWITHEVIPAIRKTGSYSTENPSVYIVKTLYETLLPSLQAAHATPKDLTETMLKLMAEAGLSKGKKGIKSRKHSISVERQEIMELLRNAIKTPYEVAEILGKTSDATRKIMWRMGKDGQLKKVNYKEWTCPDLINVNN